MLLRPAWKAIAPTTVEASTVHSTSIKMSFDWMLTRLNGSLRNHRGDIV
jgi:hypothetical protein